MVTTLTELDIHQLYDVNGGCTGCKIGLTVIAVGGVILFPSVGTAAIAAYTIYTTWT